MGTMRHRVAWKAWVPRDMGGIERNGEAWEARGDMKKHRVARMDLSWNLLEEVRFCSVFDSMLKSVVSFRASQVSIRAEP